MARQYLIGRRTTPGISRIAAGALALIARFAAAASDLEPSAVEPPGIQTRFATIGFHAGSSDLWDYAAKGVGRRHGIAAPTISVDQRDVALSLVAVKPLGSPKELPNGCREYAFIGDVVGETGLRLKVVFRAAEDDPVVRFHYEILSDRPRHLTKPEGTDRIRYLGLSLANLPSAAELRLSEFNEEFHCYMPVERALDPRLFADRQEAMGPILLAGDDTEQLLVAYEHGSTAPDEFLHYRLSPDRSVSLEAVKGNYWAGEEIGPDKPYSTVWFELEAVCGDRLALQKAYRSFVLRHLAISPESRKPRIFYNTWNYQERLRHWKGKPYLSEMNLGRMLQEIDVAHRMGVEVFVVDTGWFQKTGDWQPSPLRFPDGLKQVKARLDSYGMKLGLWFAPTTAALTSQMLKTHDDCVRTLDGKRPGPWEVWETEASVGCCVVSRFGQDFAGELVRLNRELGVTYFKFDAVDQYGCDDPNHGHGAAANSAGERGDCYAFQMPLAMAHVAELVSSAVPDAICDFDMTESGRCFGLAFLSAGKYFLINNGPYNQNYDCPLPPDGNWNLFFYPGPARDWICRSPLAFDRWIPSTLFLTHYLPDDPENNQMLSLASLMLGQDGIWGDLPAISDKGVALFGSVLEKYKAVRDDITEAFPVDCGPVGGTPEVHEKIAPNGRGVVVLFAGHGTHRYITLNHADRHFWHDEGTAVAFDDAGRAIITADFATQPGPFPKAGAHFVFFGVN
ncbi:MAG TPA: alpha-galactosidase [Opitutaceae bacterium]|nr:alpha-galactosidase [Opitutaceae bacterium]